MPGKNSIWMSLIVLGIGVYFAWLWLNFSCDLSTAKTVQIGGQTVEMPQVNYPKAILPLACSLASLENFLITVAASAFTFSGMAGLAAWLRDR